MNISIPEQLNLTDLIPAYDRVCLDFNYDFYIVLNFFLLLSLFTNYKYRWSEKYLNRKYGSFNHSVSVILVVFNTFVFLFRFLVFPIVQNVTGGI